MTLTNLRRAVLAATVLSLAGAGGAAWFSLQAEASPRPQEEWPKLFPVKPSGASDVGPPGPGPLPEYLGPAGWPQGDKPVKVDPAARPVEKPPDPFEKKYRLNGVFVGSSPVDSLAQLTAEGIPLAFSLWVGERIPEAPGVRGSALTPWRLDEVHLGSGSRPARVLFRHVDTGEEKTREVVVGAPPSLAPGPGSGGTADLGGVSVTIAGVPPKDQPPRAVLLRADRAKGEYEWEIPESEGDWFGAWGDEEASRIDVVPAKDAAGNPDGFVIKGLRPDSRAKHLGFQAEDRVISVNGERVSSTEDAISRGRRQYDSGTSTFTVVAVRSGKELKFTFHAPKKKGGGRN